MKLSIRDASPNDASAIARLLGELGYPSTVEAVIERLERMLGEPGQQVMVAESDGRVVGMATVIVRHVINSDAPFARLASIVVADSHRNRGIGTRLVAAAEEIGRAAGCDVIEVTSAEHRAGAHRFYEGLGYEERRRRFLKAL